MKKEILHARECKPEFLMEHYDLLIAGAGCIGLALALCVHHICPYLSVRVLDFSDKQTHQQDDRAFALTPASVDILKKMGCWEDIAPQTQPIKRMLITDSSTEDVVRPFFLKFYSPPSADIPLAYMVPNSILHSVLLGHAKALGLYRKLKKNIVSFESQSAYMRLHCSDGQVIKTFLLVAADGSHSQLRKMAKIKTLKFEYQQSAITCTLSHERSHDGDAYQHFLPAGPFAILPLKGLFSSIVWTENDEKAEKLINNERDFQKELELRFGARFGEIYRETRPKLSKIHGVLARDFVQHRFALVGDAAHRGHPLAGQGLNLGLKDAAVLAEILFEAHQLGQDIGSLQILESYQCVRRPDAVQMIFLTDVINRLFSNDHTVLRSIRDFGLGLVERSGFLKRYFVQQASGFPYGSTL